MTDRSTRNTPRLVRARAPLRLGLAGGGTDLSPYCDRFGGYVLNATIDKYAYATIQPRADDRVRFVAADRCEAWEGPADEAGEPDGSLKLHRGVYRRIVEEFNGGCPLPLTLTTTLDALPGSGLGSSSTLVVAMVTAYCEWRGLALGEYHIAQLAFEVERHDVGLAGGRQDQYAAAFGGVNFMEFYAHDHVIVNPLRVPAWILSELEASIVLFYSGVSRESATIIEEQCRRLSGETDPGAVQAMHRVKATAMEMKQSLLLGDLRAFVDAMNDAWQAKKRTAASVSNEHLDGLYARAMGAGAMGGKVSGAGGGGFLMFFVDPARRMDVIRALDDAPGHVSTCHFTKHGAHAWKIF
jgi:D-glycero-alpha-D-manno-heptose-7-phosphate kinase